MKNNGSSERHQNNNLIMMIGFSNSFGSNQSFYDINKKEQILSFLETKIKDSSKERPRIRRKMREGLCY
jgi:hypothetical protein